jgi:hypothetical protein
MKNFIHMNNEVKTRSIIPRSELLCLNFTIIVRNDAVNRMFPGGLKAFSNRLNVESNDKISVYNDADTKIWRIIRELEGAGLEQGKDFVTIDAIECEMWRLIHSAKVESPFWFETGVDWLRCKQSQGKIIVWYNG